MKTIIYNRVSTKEQNPSNQLRDCKELVGDNSYIVLEEYQSGFKDNERPIFESVKQKISNREIDLLVVWDLDRLYRNRKKLIEFFKYCQIYNCKIISFRQQWLNKLKDIPEPFNEIMYNMMLEIMGWISEEESKKKSERVKIAYQNRKGKWGRKSLSKNVKEEILEKRKQGLSIREISDSVFYWDKNNNRKFVSKSLVHKTLKENGV